MSPKARFLKSLVYLYSFLIGIKVIVAKNDQENELIYRFRWRTYCEMGYIKPSDFPNGRLQDEYDRRSKNFYALKNGKIIGCVRLVMSEGRSLPTADAFNIPSLDKYDKLAEISKFCIERSFRRRWIGMILMARIVDYARSMDIDYLLAGMPERLMKNFSRTGMKIIRLKEETPSKENIVFRNTARNYFKKTKIIPFIIFLKNK